MDRTGVELATVDVVVIAVYFVAVVAHGLWVSRGERNATDFFLAGDVERRTTGTEEPLGRSLVLLIAGVLAVLGGAIAPFLPSAWLDPTLRAGLPQVVVILLGVILLAVGIPSFRLVHVNWRFLVRTLRKDLMGASK